MIRHPFEGLRSELRWLSSGFLLMLLSGFGQTYYIALFAGQLKSELALSEGAFGGLYTIGTLSSAALLTWAGRLADTVSIRWLGAGVIAGLAVACVGMSYVASPLMFALVIFGLRFFGQGMCVHTAMTAMGRWFNLKRGRAVSIAGLGLPASEGIMPPLAVAGFVLIGWREVWLVSAVILVVVAAPLFVFLLKHERHPTLGPMTESAEDLLVERRHWGGGEVLRHASFYALLPGMLAPAFVITAIFFNQVTLVEVKGWELTWFAAMFPLIAIVHILASLLTGWLIDRFDARRLLPLFLVPLGLGSLMLALIHNPNLLPVAVTLLAFSIGCSSATSGALWAELYGTQFLGSIRSMTAAAAVFSSAVAPGLAGVLLDAGVPLETQFTALGLYCLLAAAAMRLLLPRLDRLIHEQ